MFKWFLTYYKNKSVFPKVIVTIISSVIVAGLTLSIPFITKYIVNNVIPTKNFNFILTWCLVLFSIYVAFLISTWVKSYIGHKFGVELERNLRNDLMKRSLRFDQVFYDTNKKGKITNTIVNDTRRISEFSHHILEDTITTIIPMVIGLILLAFANWITTLIMVVYLVCAFTYIFKKSQNRSVVYKKVYKTLSKINENNFEKLKNIELIQDFNQTKKETLEFNKRSKEYFDANDQVTKTYINFYSTFRFLMNFLYVIILSTSAILLKYSLTNYGNVIAFVLFSGLISSSFTTTLDIFQDLEKGYRSLEKVFKLFTYENKSSKTNINKDFKPGNISIKNLNFFYGDEKALDDISLEINENEKVAFVGPSGSGKTTLIKAILGLYPVGENCIFINGEDINNINQKSLFDNIGYLSQEIYIFNDTIFNNIAYAKNNCSKEDVISAATNAQIHDYIMTLDKGYDTNILELGTNLSGGQKQRIAIARMFLKNPKILILDEATSALDNITEANIISSLNKLSQDKTLITIAHRLSTIVESDNIFVLSNKRLIESGSHNILIKNKSFYAKLQNS